MSLTLTITDEAGDDLVIPAKYAVCENCEGSGTHVNPSIDGHGLTAEDFDNDPEFREAYFAGRYDIRCHECRGDRVVLVPDYSQMDADEVRAVEAHYQSEAQYRAECAAERRAGC